MGARHPRTETWSRERGEQFYFPDRIKFEFKYSN